VSKCTFKRLTEEESKASTESRLRFSNYLSTGMSDRMLAHHKERIETLQYRLMVLGIYPVLRNRRIIIIIIIIKLNYTRR
jgi:hypothetical protein